MATCPECQTRYVRRRIDQVFCSSPCNKAASNRAQYRGGVIYRALYGAATVPKKDPDRGADLTFVMREVRRWAAEDKRLGRAPPPRHQHGYDRGVK